MRVAESFLKAKPGLMGLPLSILLLFLISPVGLWAADPGYVPGKVLVKLESGIIPTEMTTGLAQVDALLQVYGIRSIERAMNYRPLFSNAYDRWWVFRFLESAPVMEIAQKLQGMSGIVHAGISNIVSLAGIPPTDTYYGAQWNLDNTGQRGGAPDADIDAPEGWAYFGGNPPGSSGITIAVIDTGIARDHPEFSGRIHIINEPEQNFTDEYLNQDTYPLWNTVEDVCSIKHGTRVTGFIAANWDNGFQVAGLDAQCRILPLKVIKGEQCYGDSTWWAPAIYYAADNNVKIISMSLQCWGSTWSGLRKLPTR